MRSLIIVFLISSFCSFGQTTDKKGTIKVKKPAVAKDTVKTTIMRSEPITGIIIPPSNDDIYSSVELMPVFPGGNTQMYNFISKNIKYPDTEKKEGVSGTVYITFVVETDGSISNVKVLRGVSGGPGCDNEAARVVKTMPKWSPGKNKGVPVRTQCNLPIKFSL